MAGTNACLAYINSVFADRPDLREAVTPHYPFRGKRPLKDDDFYPTLLRENVELVPSAAQRMTPTGIVDQNGIERQIDVLIMATGFQATNYLASLSVIGRAGQSLRDAWAGEPKAFLGITVPGFPNFYMLYGPNTNGAGVIPNLECQASYAVRNVRRMARTGITAIDVQPRVFDTYDRWLQRRLSLITSWSTVKNYYTVPSGRVVTQWPESAGTYWLMTRALRVVSAKAERRHLGYRSRGLATVSDTARKPRRFDMASEQSAWSDVPREESA
jgi:hypothetical protein